MNQGIAFARTIRALDADDFRASKLGLLFAALLIAGWTWWMFAARVPQYEISSAIQPGSENALVATFSPNAIVRIHPGQHVTLRTADAAFDSTVIAVAGASATLQSSGARTPSSAEIEVERVSPATLLLRALGRGTQ